MLSIQGITIGIRILEEYVVKEVYAVVGVHNAVTVEIEALVYGILILAEEDAVYKVYGVVGIYVAVVIYITANESYVAAIVTLCVSVAVIYVIHNITEHSAKHTYVPVSVIVTEIVLGICVRCYSLVAAIVTAYVTYVVVVMEAGACIAATCTDLYVVVSVDHIECSVEVRTLNYGYGLRYYGDLYYTVLILCKEGEAYGSVICKCISVKCDLVNYSVYVCGLTPCRYGLVCAILDVLKNCLYDPFCGNDAEHICVKYRYYCQGVYKSAILDHKSEYYIVTDDHVVELALYSCYTCVKLGNNSCSEYFSAYFTIGVFIAFIVLSSLLTYYPTGLYVTECKNNICHHGCAAVLTGVEGVTVLCTGGRYDHAAVIDMVTRIAEVKRIYDKVVVYVLGIAGVCSAVIAVSVVVEFPSKTRKDDVSVAYGVFYKGCITVCILEYNICSSGESRCIKCGMATVVSVKETIGQASAVGKYSRHDKVIGIYYVVVVRVEVLLHYALGERVADVAACPTVVACSVDHYAACSCKCKERFVKYIQLIIRCCSLIVCDKNYVIRSEVNACKVCCCGYIPSGDISVSEHFVKKRYVIVLAPRISVLNEKHVCRFSCGDDLIVNVSAILTGISDLTVLICCGELGDSGLIVMSADDGIYVSVLTLSTVVLDISVIIAACGYDICYLVAVLGIYIGDIAVSATLTGMSKNTGCGTSYFYCNLCHVVVSERCNVNVVKVLSADDTLCVLKTGGLTSGLYVYDPLTNNVTGCCYIISDVAVSASTLVDGISIRGTSGSYYGSGVLMAVRRCYHTTRAVKAAKNGVFVTVGIVKHPNTIEIPAEIRCDPALGFEVAGIIRVAIRAI